MDTRLRSWRARIPAAFAISVLKHRLQSCRYPHFDGAVVDDLVAGRALAATVATDLVAGRGCDWILVE
jgi:hypothetical protein